MDTLKGFGKPEDLLLFGIHIEESPRDKPREPYTVWDASRQEYSSRERCLEIAMGWLEQDILQGVHLNLSPEQEKALLGLFGAQRGIELQAYCYPG